MNVCGNLMNVKRQNNILIATTMTELKVPKQDRWDIRYFPGPPDGGALSCGSFTTSEDAIAALREGLKDPETFLRLHAAAVCSKPGTLSIDTNLFKIIEIK